MTRAPRSGREAHASTPQLVIPTREDRFAQVSGSLTAVVRNRLRMNVRLAR